MKKYIVLALMFSFSLMGCSVINNSPATGLTVQYATLKFIEKAEPEKRVARAQKIVTYASAAKTAFDQRSLPITEIETLVRSKIKWSELNEVDTVLVNALIATVTREVKARYINLDTNGPNEYITGSRALGWIIRGARMAGG